MEQTSALPALNFNIFFCSGLEDGMEMLMPNGMLTTDTTTIHYVNQVSQISTMMGRSGESDVFFAHSLDCLCYTAQSLFSLLSLWSPAPLLNQKATRLDEPFLSAHLRLFMQRAAMG